MSSTADRDQKTEAPTPKKRADAAREGDILQSKEWGTALIMLAGAVWFAVAGPWFIDSSLNLLKSGLSFSATDVESFDPARALWQLTQAVLLPIGTLFAATIAAAIAGPAALGSLGFRSSAIGFKANRMSPAAGLKRMFGSHGVIELGKALAKAALLGLIGYWLVSRQMPMILGLAGNDVAPAITAIGSSLATALLYLAAGLLLIAGIDVPIQMFTRNSRLRMTKQEVKEEMREADGAPEMKQAQRQRAHAILSGSARKAMSEATVVLTNPTHFAVALRYRPGIDAVPMVVARGKAEVAAAIRELANDNDVPLLSYPQLTRAIYFTTRAGQPIAEDLYIAVAAILAFVFNLDRAMADGVMQPEVEVPQAKRFDENGKKAANGS